MYHICLSQLLCLLVLALALAFALALAAAFPREEETLQRKLDKEDKVGRVDEACRANRGASSMLVSDGAQGDVGVLCRITGRHVCLSSPPPPWGTRVAPRSDRSSHPCLLRRAPQVAACEVYTCSRGADTAEQLVCLGVGGLRVCGFNWGTCRRRRGCWVARRTARVRAARRHACRVAG